MKVRNRRTGIVVEATKKEDGSYSCEGAVFTKEEMGSSYEIVKEKPKDTNASTEATIVQGDKRHEGDIGGLALALSKAQGEFTSVKKGSSGHGYDYANIEDVLKSCLPITSKYELAITQMNLTMVANKIHYTGVRTYLMHSKGGLIYSDMYMPTEKTKMNSLVQVAGGITTYLRRYGTQSALGLATTDNDGSDK